LRASHQESRTINLASRRSDRRRPSGAAIRSISRIAARLPISSQGCATSVRRGSKQSAHSKVIEATIEMSCGTLNPRGADCPPSPDRRHVVAGDDRARRLFERQQRMGRVRRRIRRVAPGDEVPLVERQAEALHALG